MQHDSEGKPNTIGSGSVMQELAPYLNLGTQLTASIVLTGALGWWLDSTFNTSPVLVVVGLCFGVIAGMVHFFKQISVLLKRQEEAKKAKNSIQH